MTARTLSGARSLLFGGAALFTACGQTTITVDGDEGSTSIPAPTTEVAATEPEPSPAAPEAGVATSAEPTMPAPELDLERGLLVYLPFDETDAGMEARDASGNGHHGEPSADPPVPSTVTPPVTFEDPRSLSFDGVSQLVDLGNPTGLDIAGTLTICAWIRPGVLDGYHNIVAHGFRLDPDLEVALRIRNEHYEFLAWAGIEGDHLARAPVPEGDLDTWHHLCGLYDGDGYHLYRDGEQIAEQVNDSAPMNMDAAWAVGGRSETSPEDSRLFQGLIDDVRIYSRALSADEVRAVFQR